MPGLRNAGDIRKHKSYFGRVCFCCTIFTTGDCRKEDEANHQEDYGEEALFCTLCNAEVFFAGAQTLFYVHSVPFILCAKSSIVGFAPISLYLSKSILLHSLLLVYQCIK